MVDGTGGQKPLAGAIGQHSAFQGGPTLAAANPAVDSIDTLIKSIAAATNVPADTVHKILSMAYPSTAQYVLKQVAAQHPQVASLISRAGVVAV